MAQKEAEDHFKLPKRVQGDGNGGTRATSVLVVDGVQSCPPQDSMDIMNSMGTLCRSAQKRTNPDKPPITPK